MPAIASPPEVPAWDVDADWWGPTWDVVTSVGKAGPDKPRTGIPGLAAQDVPVPAASYVVAPAPSWGQILATTVRLWVSRRRRGSSSELPSAEAVPPSAGAALPSAGAVLLSAGPAVPSAGAVLPSAGAAVPSAGPAVPSADAVLPSAGPAPRLEARRPRVAGRASAVWAAHARLLSAAMLSAGLLAAGAGTAGLVVVRASSAPAVRLAARPSPVTAPSGRTVVPVSLSAVQPTPRPVWLTIPAIGVKAPIINLGLNRNGTLQVPSTTTVAGWYTGSPRPGATGSAVIAGHVDSRTGPGIFFWLRKMRPGERIYVRRTDGTLAVFTVTAVRIYTKSRFPTAMVYGPVPDAELRLITCGGTFDYARHSYLSNVVVYARLSA
ncbi:MAG: class F sortase [Streptosporangiaceae bacterium]